MELNDDDQQDNTKHFKQQWDIDAEEETQKITAARNPMKKNEPVCVTINQKFAMKNRLKKMNAPQNMRLNITRTKNIVKNMENKEILRRRKKIPHTGDKASLNRCG